MGGAASLLLPVVASNYWFRPCNGSLYFWAANSDLNIHVCMYTSIQLWYNWESTGRYTIDLSVYYLHRTCVTWWTRSIMPELLFSQSDQLTSLISLKLSILWV